MITDYPNDPARVGSIVPAAQFAELLADGASLKPMNRVSLRSRGIGVRKPVRLKARRRPVQTTTVAQEA